MRFFPKNWPTAKGYLLVVDKVGKELEQIFFFYLHRNEQKCWLEMDCLKSAYSYQLTLFSSFYSGYLTNVTVIETEGVTDGVTPMWVESYYVSTSNNSETESFVNYTEGGNIRIVSFLYIFFFNQGCLVLTWDLTWHFYDYLVSYCTACTAILSEECRTCRAEKMAQSNLTLTPDILDYTTL